MLFFFPIKLRHLRVLVSEITGNSILYSNVFILTKMHFRIFDRLRENPNMTGELSSQNTRIAESVSM